MNNGKAAGRNPDQIRRGKTPRKGAFCKKEKKKKNC